MTIQDRISENFAVWDKLMVQLSKCMAAEEWRIQESLMEVNVEYRKLRSQA
jgi:hypothetical protein